MEFCPKALNKALQNLIKNVEQKNSNLIIVLDSKCNEYKIIISNSHCLKLIDELKESYTIQAKDNVIVDECNDPIWISLQDTNEDLFFRNNTAEQNIIKFLKDNNLTKEELSSLLKNI